MGHCGTNQKIAGSIPVAKRSKARVCDRSLAGVAGPNLAGGMDGCVVCVVQKRTKGTIRTKKYR